MNQRGSSHMREGRKGKNRLQLLSQALSAATSSINLARQLIKEIEREGGALERPGLVGVYDGEFMTTEAGKKYPVPENYAAKTKLIFGDKLKMVEGRDGRRFKYIEKIPYVEVEATLAKKDGKFVAISGAGSHKLIQSAVKFLEGAEKDKIKILLPKDKKDAPFAALMEVVGKKRAGVEREGRRERGRPEPTGKPRAKEEGEKKEKKKEEKVEEKEEPKKETKKPAKKPAAKKTAAKKTTAKKTTAKKTAAKKPAAKKTTAKKAATKKAEPPSEEELV